MEKWSKLPLSIVGRINSVKMTIMPRFLYLFQTVPVFISKIFFKELNKYISMFIWNKNIPRIRKEYLERQKEDGGLSLPNFLYYYWATNIHKLLFWFTDLSDDETQAWVHLEQHSSNPVSLICAPDRKSVV